MWIETYVNIAEKDWKNVTPCVGVWIETALVYSRIRIGFVTPCVGVWIETEIVWDQSILPKSHPAWVCGLKHR